MYVGAIRGILDVHPRNRIRFQHPDVHKPNNHIDIDLLPHLQSHNMASESKDSAFNILGSSKLNTADGKNPTSSATNSTSTQPGIASGQRNSEEHRQVRTLQSDF